MPEEYQVGYRWYYGLLGRGKPRHSRGILRGKPPESGRDAGRYRNPAQDTGVLEQARVIR